MGAGATGAAEAPAAPFAGAAVRCRRRQPLLLIEPLVNVVVLPAVATVATKA